MGASIKMMKSIAVVALCMFAAAAGEAEASADAGYFYGRHYGYGLAHHGYYGYPYAHHYGHYYGKRSADAEPTAALSPPLMLMLTTDTTDIPLHMLTTDRAMPTTDTTDIPTHMPTMDTMARGPLMPSPLLMLDTCTDTMDTDIDTDMPT